MSKIDSISTLGSKPLPDSSYPGFECYELPEYISVRNEIQKLSRIGQSGSIDWFLVIDNSVKLLSNYTKDIQIASYLAYSLFHQYRFHGLAVGLKFLLDLINTYWDEAYPQGREKAKIEFLNWFAFQSLNYLSQIHLDEEDKHFQKQIINTLKKIETVLLTRQIHIDYFANLRTRIEAGDTATPPIQEQVAEPQLTGEVSEVSPLNDSNKNLESVSLILTKYSRELMQQEPVNAYAYYINRVAAWLRITEVPFSENRVTLVKAPEYFNYERIKKTRETGLALEIVTTAEELVSPEPFWLDLHFISLNALKKLDAKFNQAFEVIRRELVNFLNRFPGIEQLQFSDGTPFLSDEYKEQLAVITSKQISNISGTIIHLSELEQNQLNQIKEVISALKQNNETTKISQLELLKKDSISEKVKLLSLMAICDSLLYENEQSILKPNLSFIVELIDKHQLTTWEPGLALEALILVYRGMKFLKNAIPEHQLDHVFSLITQIDMKVAMELAHFK